MRLDKLKGGSSIFKMITMLLKFKVLAYGSITCHKQDGLVNDINIYLYINKLLDNGNSMCYMYILREISKGPDSSSSQADSGFEQFKYFGAVNQWKINNFVWGTAVKYGLPTYIF